MEAEPTRAELPRRKRRWFQFSLRTLMIVVTLLAAACAYVGWQAAIVRERKSLIDSDAHARLEIESDAAVPTVRRWLGDHSYRFIYVRTRAEIQTFKDAFPEADVKYPIPPSKL